MKKLNWHVWLALLKMLEENWKGIEYKYSRLSTKEKKQMSETEFNYLVSEIEALKQEEKNGVVYK